ncbi:MAG: ATP-binding cassette domain-containing protein [Candidatus Aminicenantes bacterium]|nr:ATP-binding cassette domain-containing protein [Candidatus Aminicenantes bacterium]
MSAIKTENLTKIFGHVEAVKSIDLEVEKGQIVGLVGPDGAGKTTFLRLLAGLLMPSEGSIIVDGIEVIKAPLRVKQRIGYMPQQFSLYGDLTVSENLKFFADLYRVPERKYGERKEELLSFSQLAPFQGRLARNLSGGMQKKLALACNLFHSPAVLLLDEPTTGVDPVSRKELWQLLYQLNDQGATILLTTPYMDEAQKCHQVGLVYEGRLLIYQSPQRLIEEMPGEIIELIIEKDIDREMLQSMPGLKYVYPFGETLHLVFIEGKHGEQEVRKLSEKHGIGIKRVQRIRPSFEDVFFSLVQEQTGAPVP